MNAGRDVERLIADWLVADSPRRAPDRVLGMAATVIDRTSQRPASRVPWRNAHVNRYLLPLAAALIVMIGAAYLLMRPASNVGPAAPPSPSPTVAPTAAGATDLPLVPASQLPTPSSGANLSATLVGRTYRADPDETQGSRHSVLTLRAADDPHCAAMFGGRSTCFTILWSPVKAGDPGVRGAARVANGNLVLSFDLVPYSQECVGLVGTYAIDDSGTTLSRVVPACGYSAFVALN